MQTAVADWVRIGLVAASFILVLKIVAGPGGLIKAKGINSTVGTL